MKKILFFMLAIVLMASLVWALTVPTLAPYNTTGNMTHTGDQTVSGNVGIGTTTPTNLANPTVDKILDIKGAATTGITVHISSDTNKELSIINSAGASFFDVTGAATASNNNFIFRTSDTNNNNTPTERMRITSVGDVGIGTTTPDRRLHSELDDASASAVSYLSRFTHTTSGTPAAGIGAGMEFEIETAADNNEVGAIIEAVTTDITATSEDVDLVFKVMTAGAAANEKLRIASTGVVANTSQDASATPVSATNPLKYFGFNISLADDTDGTCATGTDCITLPIPTSTGRVEIWTDSEESATYLVDSAGAVTEVREGGTAFSPTDTCNGTGGVICVYDGGANTLIHNDAGATRIISITMWYD